MMACDYAVAPHYDILSQFSYLAWHNFHGKIIKRDKASLDKVIDVIDATIKGIFPQSWHEEYMNASEESVWDGEKRFVTHLDISQNLIDYLNSETNEQEIINLEEGNRFQWNAASNILRGLKRMRDNEPVFLLPEKDKRLLAGFINRLNSPPLERSL